MSFIQPNTGNALYPMSGVDISPLLFCPNIDTFYFIDDHLLLNKEHYCNLEKTYNVKEFVDFNFLNRIMTEYKTFYSKDKVPLSFGFFCSDKPTDIMYDYTGLYCMLARMELLSADDEYYTKSDEKGLVHILYQRILDHTDYVPTILKKLYYNVYEITLEKKTNHAETKKIIYIQEKIAYDSSCHINYYSKCIPPPCGINWLANQRVNFSIMIIKGDPYYANNSTDLTAIQKRALIRCMIVSELLSNSDRKSFRLISDQELGNGSFPTTPALFSCKDKFFGYGNFFGVYDFESIECYMQD